MMSALTVAILIGISLLPHLARSDGRPPQLVSAVWRNPQHLDLFITDYEGRVMSTWWESGCGWQPWSAIHPGTALGAPGQPVTAVWSPQHFDHLDLFITGRDGRVMNSWWTADRGWQPWSAIRPDTALGAPGQPVTAVWSNPQHLDLFITGRDGRVMNSWWTADRGWQLWSAIRPDTALGVPDQPVTAVWSSPQHLDLFITGRDGRVMNSWWTADRGWQPWSAIRPDTALGAPGQPVTAVWSSPQHLDLFITGRDGRVMNSWWTADRGWQLWSAIFPDEEKLSDPRNVVTQLYDNARTGAYLHETMLKPSNVSASSFGKLFQRQVEGQILAQPLYLRDVPVAHNTRKNLVFVGTAANLLYAFDADDTNPDPNAAVVFKIRLGLSLELSPGHHSKAPRFCDETFPHYIGITSTPVIDEATGTMYLVTYDSGIDQHVLHALDIRHGLAEKRLPVVIAAPGFDPQSGRNRAALLLLNQTVYVAFASFICDSPQPFSGWVFGYRAIDLAQTAIFRVPVANGAGIWQSGRGLVAGPDGAIYLMTGNDAAFPPASASLANSFLKLRPACYGPGLSLERAFSPSNSVILSNGDTDLGSSGPLLLPGNRLIGGGKQGRVYVLDAATMTLTQNQHETDGLEGFQAFKNMYHNDNRNPACTAPDDPERICRVVNMPQTDRMALRARVTIGFEKVEKDCYLSPICYQFDQLWGPNIHAGFVYWQGTDSGTLYALPEKEFLRAFRYNLLARHVDIERPVMTSATVYASRGMPGGAISISANGNRDGIVWVSVHKEDAIGGVHPGRLVALDTTSLNELWRDDDVPAFAKFNPPTVADGKVFLPTFATPTADFPDGLGWLIVYGLKHGG
jgi:hypothetical protein